MSEPRTERIEFRLPEFDNIEHVLRLGDTAIEQESQAALVSLARIESALAAAEAELETLRAALDAITAVKRNGLYNNGSECREIAAAALSSDGGTT